MCVPSLCSGFWKEGRATFSSSRLFRVKCIKFELGKVFLFFFSPLVPADQLARNQIEKRKRQNENEGRQIHTYEFNRLRFDSETSFFFSTYRSRWSHRDNLRLALNKNFWKTFLIFPFFFLPPQRTDTQGPNIHAPPPSLIHADYRKPAAEPALVQQNSGSSLTFFLRGVHIFLKIFSQLKLFAHSMWHTVGRLVVCLYDTYQKPGQVLAASVARGGFLGDTNQEGGSICFSQNMTKHILFDAYTHTHTRKGGLFCCK